MSASSRKPRFANFRGAKGDYVQLQNLRVGFSKSVHLLKLGLGRRFFSLTFRVAVEINNTPTNGVVFEENQRSRGQFLTISGQLLVG